MKVAWTVAMVASGCSGGVAGSGGQESVSAALDSYTATANPIVLIPGLLGFKTLLGSVDYFTAIPAALEEGGARVFVVSASQAESSVVRGQEIIPQLEALRGQTGATRFNLVGHSQGALDAR